MCWFVNGFMRFLAFIAILQKITIYAGAGQSALIWVSVSYLKQNRLRFKNVVGFVFYIYNIVRFFLLRPHNLERCFTTSDQGSQKTVCQ